MGWQIMGTGHLRSDAPADLEEARIRRIAREEMHKMLDEMADEALRHLKELNE